jgi:hypothetical protein
MKNKIIELNLSLKESNNKNEKLQENYSLLEKENLNKQEIINSFNKNKSLYEESNKLFEEFENSETDYEENIKCYKNMGEKSLSMYVFTVERKYKKLKEENEDCKYMKINNINFFYYFNLFYFVLILFYPYFILVRKNIIDIKKNEKKGNLTEFDIINIIENKSIFNFNLFYFT